ncbi:MAG: hypothetical protein ABI212_04745, partial [Burkholderiaceae bacterium]
MNNPTTAPVSAGPAPGAHGSRLLSIAGSDSGGAGLQAAPLNTTADLADAAQQLLEKGARAVLLMGDPLAGGTV